MTKSKIFLILSLNFILGIFLASIFKLDAFLIYALGVISVIIVTLGYKNKITLVAGLAILFLVIGIWRTQIDLQKIAQINPDGKNIFGNAVVAKEPEEKDNYKNIVIKSEDDTRILLRANINADINYGDEIKIECVLKIPENKDDFDYRMYLAKDKIFYLCQNAKFEKTGNNSGNKLYLGILNLKNKMSDNINRVIPYPESALGNGLIFGGSGDLPKDLKNNFSRTGMTHIVAVSGYNVTIIAEYLILLGIFIGLWRKQAFWFAIAGIFLFVLMCGFPSSAVRAGVMGSLLLWAMKNGRLANSWNAIIFAGAVMTAINPLVLRWDVGFQLSFLAAIGIIALSPFWEKVFVKNHKALGFSEIFLLSLSAQIFVLPIILYNFQTLSLVSLAANLLILLIIPISMLLVFLTAVAGLISNILALPFAWLAYLPLKYEVWVVDTLGNVPWASRTVENFRVHWLFLWYLVLASAVYFLRKKLNAKSENNL
ncbi:MAG: ComEC/Rec2 family competence protein [Parcubacteria group bacterium]